MPNLPAPGTYVPRSSSLPKDAGSPCSVRIFRPIRHGNNAAGTIGAGTVQAGQPGGTSGAQGGTKGNCDSLKACFLPVYDGRATIGPCVPPCAPFVPMRVARAAPRAVHKKRASGAIRRRVSGCLGEAQNTILSLLWTSSRRRSRASASLRRLTGSSSPVESVTTVEPTT